MKHFIVLLLSFALLATGDIASEGVGANSVASQSDDKKNEPDRSTYMVVNLETGAVHFSETAPDLNKDTCRTTELWLRRIPAGTFMMGSPDDENGREDNETLHQVTLTVDFFIGVFECTQRQWELIEGGKPSKHIGECRPVESVSYNMIRGNSDAGRAGWGKNGHGVDETSFIGRLRDKTGLPFDLPTEAQWEYACRAKTSSAFNSGQDLSSIDNDIALNDVGRFEYYRRHDGRGGYLEHTAVGSYAPNQWGLYDMHGNVWEWCLDWDGEYPAAPVIDPQGAVSGTKRVVRGGAYNNRAKECRSAIRGKSTPQSNYYGFGFRIACPADHLTAKTGDGGNDALPEKSLVDEKTYLIVDLQNWRCRYEALGPDVSKNACRTTELWLRRIPAGTFMMGMTEGGKDDDATLHWVTLSEDYYIGVFEVTQAQWKRVMGNAPSRFRGECRPVESVSYNMVRGENEYGRSFVGQLRIKTGLSFDLPTEAQWEYACRAGGDTVGIGRFSGNMKDGRGYEEHTVVGGYPPNGWGLYDMLGNVEEWCLDWHGPFSDEAISNPEGALNGIYRVVKGGHWYSGEACCRSAFRHGFVPEFKFCDLGFRISCKPR
ncbi:MAG: formylglycine-generating enzyme family protein [Victivallales bacterium]|nr:formylglycine-generating enzyme family protein [Victivallales bacterium]